MSSTDRKVTKDLIQVTEDGAEGFESGADALADTDRADLAETFRELAVQRRRFSDELEEMAAAYGDDIDEDGSIKGLAHRGWMKLKDALTGSSPEAILDAAEQGEDHAVESYEDALGRDISDDLRSLVARQLDEVRSAHDRVKSLRNAA